MSFFGTCFRCGALLASISAALAQIGAAFVALPSAIAAEFLDLIDTAQRWASRILENRTLALTLFILLLIGGTVGYVAYYETSVFLSAIDIAYSLFVRVWQPFNRYVLLTLRDFLRDAWAAYNTILVYVFARFSLLFTDLLDVIECVLQNLNFITLLRFLRPLWEFVYSMFFVFTTGPIVLARNAVVNTMTPLYFTEVPGQPTDARYEFPGPGDSAYMGRFDPVGFGAFPGNDPTADPTLNPFQYSLRVARTLYRDVANIVGTTGRLFVDVASDTRQPSALLMGNLLRSVDNQDSTMRKLADVLTRITSFVAGSSFYPFEAVPTTEPGGTQAVFEQRYRKDVEKVISTIYRIIARIVRYLFLLVNDVTTVSRVSINVDDKRAFSGATLEQMFQGFPVIDLIINGNLLAQQPLNIIRANYELCRISASYYQLPFMSHYLQNTAEYTGILAQAPALQVAITDATVITHIEECLTLTKPTPFNGARAATQLFEVSSSIDDDDDFQANFNALGGAAFIPGANCPLWRGDGVLSFEQRIDYIGEIFDIVQEIAFFLQDPTCSGTLTAVEKAFQRGAFDVVECFIDRLLHSAIYTIDLLTTTTALRLAGQSTVNIGGRDFEKCFDNPLIPIYYYSLEGCINRLFSDLLFERDPTDGSPRQCAAYYEGPPPGVTLLPAALESQEASALLCFIARLSTDLGGFFTNVCDLVSEGFRIESGDIFNGFFDLVILQPTADLRCNQFRKRSIPFADQRHAQSAPWKARLIGAHLFAARVASETRRLGPSLGQCLRPTAETTCSAAPHFAAVFDCIERQLLPHNDTLLHKHLVRSSFVRNIILRGTQLVDALYGCPDSDVVRYTAWAHSTLATAHRAAHSFAQFFFDYSSAHSTCEDRAKATHPADAESVYMQCVHDDPTYNATLVDSVRHFDGTCGETLRKFGFAYTARSVPIHALCMWLYGVGARANARGYSALPLEDYLRFDRLPLALTSSTQLLAPGDRTALGADYEQPPPLPSVFQAEPQYNATAAPSAVFQRWANSIRANFPLAGKVHAMGTFYADLHDQLVMQAGEYEVEELDTKHTALVNNALALSHAYTAPETLKAFDKFVHRKRSVPLSETSPLTQLSDALRSSTLGWQGEFRDVVYTASVVRTRNATAQRAVVRTANFAHHIDWDGAVEPIIDGTLLHRGRENGMAALHQLAYALRARDGSHSSRWLARHRIPLETASVASSVLGTAFRILNRRLRLESMPPTQSLAVALDVMSGQYAPQDLSDWAAGRLGYIVGKGFVSQDEYAVYMQNEQTQRERWASAYALSLQPTDEARGFLVGPRRDQHIPRRLPPSDTTLGDRVRNILRMRRRRSASRAVSHVARAQFLVRNGIAHLDTQPHRHAGHNLTSVTTHQIAALGGCVDPVTEAAEWIIALFVDNFDIVEFTQPIVDYGVTLVGAVADLVDQVVADPTGTLLDPIRCNPPADYTLNGGGTYKLGCIPYANERWLDWVEPFPQNSAKGLFGVLESDGQIDWPDKLITQRCAVPRNPDALCPNSDISLWSDLTDTLTGPVATTFDPQQWVDSICFVDHCVLDPTMPLCPVLDYCPQEYVDLVDEGTFANGLDVLLAWLRAVRLWVVELFAATSYDRGLISLLFIAFALGPFYPVLAQIALIVPIGHALFTQSPEQFLYPLFPLYILHETLPLLAWLLWFVAVSLGALGAPIAIDVSPVRDAILFVMPDQLVATVLDVVPLVSDIASDFIVTLQNNTQATTNLEEMFCALLSTVKLAEWVAFAAALLFIAYIALRLLRPILDVLLSVLTGIIDIALACLSFRRGQRIATALGTIDDLEERSPDPTALETVVIEETEEDMPIDTRLRRRRKF